MNLEKIVKENYDISILKIEKNEDSTDGNVYLIHSIGAKYIIKIYNDKEHTEAIINLYNFLNDNNMIVPKVIINNCNEMYVEFEEKYIVMYSFLEGINLSTYIKENNNSLDSEVVIKTAREIRKFHRLTENKKFKFNEIEFANKLERKSVLHFDLTKDNIFIKNNKIEFIDFDDAKYGDSVCDVAIALCFLCVSKKRGLDRKNADIFLDSYYNEEDDLRRSEEPYIKEYAIKWIDYLLNGHEFDSSLKESFEVKKKEIMFYKSN